jgi:membrane-associated HD superfamily phosphohydrolase
MICDSSEAISKVQNLSQDEIRNLLKRNINEKFVDGQFNESNLTFNDLTIIEETIYKNLLGLHQRTKYKEIPDENETKNS